MTTVLGVVTWLAFALGAIVIAAFLFGRRG
jgi:hypothetical protein